MQQRGFGRELVEASPVDEATKTAFTVEEGIDFFRLRPGMYVGGTDTFGLHELFKEIINNAVDEATAGYCTKITVVYQSDGSLSVQDNGRGIPTKMDAETGKALVELFFIHLHWSNRLKSFGGYTVLAPLV